MDRQPPSAQLIFLFGPLKNGSSYIYIKDEDIVFTKRATQIRGPPRRGTPLHLTTPAYVHETPPPPPSNYVTKGCEWLLRVSPREHEMKRVSERVRVVVLYARVRHLC